MPKIIEKDQDFWHFVTSTAFVVLSAILIIFLRRQDADYDISIFDFIIMILATFRLVRLLTYDSVTDYIRRYLAGYDDGFRKTLSDLVNCPWCTGVWMSLLVVFLFYALPGFRTFLLIMALAGAGTFIQILVWKIGLEDNNLRIKYDRDNE